MPKFSPKSLFRLYTEGRRSKDSILVSSLVREQIDHGGVPVYVWMLNGFHDQRPAGVPTTALDDSTAEIQDVILMETRDRKYADDAVRLFGAYRTSDVELDFSRFGIMLMNDTVQMEFHKETMELQCGRRLQPGDVIEAPHLRDVANDGRAGNRWYEIKTIVRSPNSWDHAYENHTLAITMKPIKDAQEFIDLMERETDSGLTLGDTNSNRAAYDEVAAKVQEAALEQAGTSWWDTTQVYIDPSVDSSHVWTDDGKPPNAVPVERVDAFPSSPTEGDYVLRVDFLPNRLFRYQGGRWLLKEIDRKREWGTYNWTTKLAEFMTDRTEEMDSRPWQYRSIHDVGTSRQERFSPSPKLDGYADQQQLVREGLARSGNVPRTPQVDSGTADGEGTGVFGGIGSASGSGG